jgi:septal ring factor EnvC (AmiA/AmiB activator)
MPAKTPSPYAPLVDAAAAFADELRSYALLSEAFQRLPLVSAKHLERINETLTQIAESEQRLGVCGQKMAQAVSAAREEQERLARATLDRIPAVKERTAQLGGLLARFEELGNEAAALNQTAVSFDEAERAGEGGDQNARARVMLDKLRALAERAQEVTALARDAEFEELARRSHALYQQLFSAQKKLEMATVS